MHAGKPVFLSLAEIMRMHPVAGATGASLSDPLAPAAVDEPAVEVAAKPNVPASLAIDGQPIPPPARDERGPAGSVPPAPESAAAIRSARLFRAAVGDALEAFVADLVRAVAVDIVAREVEIAPIDVASIVQRTFAERWFDEPVRVRVAPADAQIGCELPVVADARLEPGDAILECRYGSVDARLHVRLAAVLGELRR